jgi:shikimate kinase
MSEHRKHIYLAGFMGVGKSAVGLKLAQQLERQLIDLDAEIVAGRAKSIAEIFESEGEGAFREYETSALRGAAERDASVIALGGGVPTVADNVLLIRKTGRTVLLTADWRSIWERVKDSGDRPLLNPIPGGSGNVSDFDTFVTFAEPILSRRIEAYNQIADLTIDTTGLSVDVISDSIVCSFTEKGWL